MSNISGIKKVSELLGNEETMLYEISGNLKRPFPLGQNRVYVIPGYQREMEEQIDIFLFKVYIECVVLIVWSNGGIFYGLAVLHPCGAWIKEMRCTNHLRIGFSVCGVKDNSRNSGWEGCICDYFEKRIFERFWRVKVGNGL